MTKKKRKRTKFSEILSSIPTGKLSVLAIVLAYLNTAMLFKISTFYFTIDGQNLTLFVFVATGILPEISWLLKS